MVSDRLIWLSLAISISFKRSLSVSFEADNLWSVSSRLLSVHFECFQSATDRSNWSVKASQLGQIWTVHFWSLSVIFKGLTFCGLRTGRFWLIPVNFRADWVGRFKTGHFQSVSVLLNTSISFGHSVHSVSNRQNRFSSSRSFSVSFV